MIGPHCDEECPDRSVTVAALGLVGSVLAALAPVWLRRRHAEEDERRKLERRVAVLEAQQSAEEEDE